MRNPECWCAWNKERIHDTFRTSQVQLQIHMAKHGAEKRFMCHLCSKLFIVPELLRKHMAIHAPDRARAHRCEECDSAFYSNKMLQEHIK